MKNLRTAGILCLALLCFFTGCRTCSPLNTLPRETLTDGAVREKETAAETRKPAETEPEDTAAAQPEQETAPVLSGDLLDGSTPAGGDGSLLYLHGKDLDAFGSFRDFDVGNGRILLGKKKPDGMYRLGLFDLKTGCLLASAVTECPDGAVPLICGDLAVLASPWGRSDVLLFDSGLRPAGEIPFLPDSGTQLFAGS